MSAPARRQHFQSDWLSLREPADHQSRAASLVAQLQDRFHDHDRLQIIDLGAGQGSNLRYLAPRLNAAQNWLLVDHDPELLQKAREPLDACVPLHVQTRHSDLAAFLDDSYDSDPHPDLVTSAALLDLADREWVEQLAERCWRWAATVLAVLTVDGRRHFIRPDGTAMEDDLDRFMHETFNCHQLNAKGLGDGPALGSNAAVALPEIFHQQGFAVQMAASDWVLPAQDSASRALALALVDDWHRAAREQAPEQHARIDRWYRLRRAALNLGEIGLIVGHFDLLATPRHGPGT